MAALGFALGLLAILWLVSVERRVGSLERMVGRLESRLAALRVEKPAEQQSVREVTESGSGDRPTVRPERVQRPAARAVVPSRPVGFTAWPPIAPPKGHPEPTAMPRSARPAAPSAPSRLTERWRELERQAVENWTGILGAVVLVAGITFVGGYTGLRLSPFHRSLMIAGAGVVLMGAAYGMRRRDSFLALSNWLRSAGAAVVLLACFGSSAIPGLAWIERLGPGLLLLLLGIGVNMGVAYRANEQIFASLHVVLSLLPLLIVPQSNTTLVVATVVAATGVRLAWRPSWQVQVLVTLATYGAFQGVWFSRVVEVAPTLLSRWAGAGSALLVSAFIAARQHAGREAGEERGALDLAIQVGAWAFLGIALAGYAGNTPVRGLSLIALAGVVHQLGRRARRKGARSLYVSETLVAEALAVWGLVALQAFVFHWLLIPALAFAMSALFHRLGVSAQEPLLERTGLYALRVSGVALLISGLVTLQPNGPLGPQHAATLFGAALFGATYHAHLTRSRRGTGPIGSPTGGFESALTAGLLALLASVDLYGAGWMTLAAVQAGLALLIAARRARSEQLALGAFAVLGPIFPLAWYDLLSQHPMPVSEQVRVHLAALVVGGLLVIWAASPARLDPTYRRSGIYGLGLTIAVALFTLLEPVSAMLPTIAWITASFLALLVADRAGAAAASVLHVAWVYVTLFAVGFGTWVASEPRTVRLVAEMAALAVMALWWTYRSRRSLAGLEEWRVTQPLALEAILAMLAAMTLLEAPTAWRPLTWAALAVAAAALGRWPSIASRLRVYSLAFFWIAIYELMRLGDVSEPFDRMPSIGRLRLLGSLTIGVQIAYLTGLSPSLDLNRVSLPPVLSGLRGAVRGLADVLAIVLCYPFFVGIAVFLYRQFNGALLTPLWAAEAFVVFAVSLILRENQFRYAALAALGAVVLRLLVFDLSQSNLGVRGAVFIGVGVLMLGMNSLYNRYKDRYAQGTAEG